MYLFQAFLLNHSTFRVLLATIQERGICPCPCCLIYQTKLDQLGLISDNKTCINKAQKYDVDTVNKAWKTIYTLGKPISGVHIEWLLKPSSAIPILV
jgi:hypothetical protein